MSEVEVRLFASLRKWQSKIETGYALAAPKPVREILSDLGIPEADVAVIAINGRRAGMDSLVAGGDSLRLFPLIGGG